MPPVDASIPLSFQQPKFESPLGMYTQALSLKDLQAQTQVRDMQFAKGMQTLRDQQRLSQIFSQDGTRDANGLPTQDAIKQIDAFNPQLAATINKNRLESLYKIAETSARTSETAVRAQKLKTDTLHPIMEEAYGAYEQAIKDGKTEEEAARASGQVQIERLGEVGKTGAGGFKSDDPILSRVLTPRQLHYGLTTHAERLAEEKGGTGPTAEIVRADKMLREGKITKEERDAIVRKETAGTRPEETPEIKDIKERERLLAELATVPKGSDKEKSLKRQIADLTGIINRKERVAGAAEDHKPPTGYRYKPGGTELEPIPGGPAVKDRRDAMQADALSAYRARYPMGYMPDMYGKNQPTPESYTEQYIANKEKGGKGPPTDVKGSLPKVSNKKEFDKLKKGDRFIDSRTGKESIKG